MAIHELNRARVIARCFKNIPASGQKRAKEKLWREFFADPSQWWDHRSEKVNPKYPDFEHKKTCEGLWLTGKFKPPWVEAELATLTTGTVPLSIFSWNKMLERHVKAREHGKAIDLFQQMKAEGMHPDEYTFVPVLNACTSLRALEEGRRIHLQIIQTGHESDVYVGSALVDMYAKCGSIEDAWMVFNQMPVRNVVSWTAMILAYVKCGQGLKALQLFRQMYGEGVKPNNVTFVGLLNACASLMALEEGRYVHKQVIQRGYESDVFIGNCLVDMYAKCGSIEDAWTVFKSMSRRDVVTWNAMIVGYVKCGQEQKALELFQQMHGEGVEPDPVTFVGVLTASANLESIEDGRYVHGEIIQRGYGSEVVVSNCLVDMYAKCGNMEDAWAVFDKMSTRDVVSWNAMIARYVKYGQGKKALELFSQMHDEGVQPNRVTFLGLLNACASLAALDEGRRFHEHVIHHSYESDMYIANSLVDMYAKCGSMNEAWRVFNKMPTRDVVSWNAVLGGCALHGYANKGIECFERMCQEGVQVNEVTYVSLLSACSHGGLVDEGWCYFTSMSAVHRISPTVDHYVCMVDLLGRAGCLHEAEDLIKTMTPCDATATIWMSLLAACRVHGNVTMGGNVAKQALRLDPGNSAGYVLLSNLYAAAGKWDKDCNH